MAHGIRPGDSISLSRDGKIFLTQYSTLGAFVSLTRVVGDDPEADIAAMQETLDHLWHEQLLRNHRGVDGAYGALGSEGDLERLVEYLEAKVEHERQAEAAPKRPKVVRRRASS